MAKMEILFRCNDLAYTSFYLGLHLLLNPCDTSKFTSSLSRQEQTDSIWLPKIVLEILLRFSGSNGGILNNICALELRIRFRGGSWFLLRMARLKRRIISWIASLWNWLGEQRYTKTRSKAWPWKLFDNRMQSYWVHWGIKLNCFAFETRICCQSRNGQYSNHERTHKWTRKHLYWKRIEQLKRWCPSWNHKRKIEIDWRRKLALE